jgi:hypothetical protein
MLRRGLGGLLQRGGSRAAGACELLQDAQHAAAAGDQAAARGFGEQQGGARGARARRPAPSARWVCRAARTCPRGARPPTHTRPWPTPASRREPPNWMTHKPRAEKADRAFAKRVARLVREWRGRRRRGLQGQPGWRRRPTSAAWGALRARARGAGASPAVAYERAPGPTPSRSSQASWRRPRSHPRRRRQRARRRQQRQRGRPPRRYQQQRRPRHPAGHPAPAAATAAAVAAVATGAAAAAPQAQAAAAARRPTAASAAGCPHS